MSKESKPLSPSLLYTKSIEILFKCNYGNFLPNLVMPCSVIPIEFNPNFNDFILPSSIFDKIVYKPASPILHESRLMLTSLAFK